MSKRSRCDAFGTFYLDFPRTPAGPIPQPIERLQAFEAALKAFIESKGFFVRSLTFDVKDGRYEP